MNFEQRKAIAAKLRKSRKVESPFVAISYHRSGSETGRGPGTEFVAKVKFPPEVKIFLIYLPAPRNSRQTALAVLCRHLEGLTLGTRGAIVSEP